MLEKWKIVRHFPSMICLCEWRIVAFLENHLLVMHTLITMWPHLYLLSFFFVYSAERRRLRYSSLGCWHVQRTHAASGRSTRAVLLWGVIELATEANLKMFFFIVVSYFFNIIFLSNSSILQQI